MPEHWPAEFLPDGTRLHRGLNFNGEIHDWTGRPCPRCLDHPGIDPEYPQDDGSETCCMCAGTGDEHGPVWLVEE
jgi:hypothetical protein